MHGDWTLFSIKKVFEFLLIPCYGLLIYFFVFIAVFIHVLSALPKAVLQENVFNSFWIFELSDMISVCEVKDFQLELVHCSDNATAFV